MAGGNAYSLLHENKSGWNPEVFRERYSEVLERFDYIVGDWGYSQLRLRGFYKDGHPRATKESVISSLIDYINEYCNFGCAYFVLAKVDSKTLTPEELAQGQQNAADAASASAAAGEAVEQAAETAATHNGPLMRWPLKERSGGPARVPNVTVSAVARAAAESAERRRESNAANAGGSQHRGGSRQGQEGGGSYNRHGKPGHGQGGGERRQGQGSGNQSHNQERGGQGRGEHGQHRGNQGGPRGPRPQQNAEGGNRQAAEGRNHGEAGGAHPNAEAARNGSRWPGKNRRRKSFGGKQGPRPEGAQRNEGGGNNPRASE
ncbi:YutD-like domain-containing protein [Cohnella panacarvi]|uniref:YutD-like domain-containing protein n=1 Tax=Cohnella panacarvi TaxID=400776 RepID=UPI000A03E03F|nr:YutD-like domain-containing protein [Cohnella panacarvi]